MRPWAVFAWHPPTYRVGGCRANMALGIPPFSAALFSFEPLWIYCHYVILDCVYFYAYSGTNVAIFQWVGRLFGVFLCCTHALVVLFCMTLWRCCCYVWHSDAAGVSTVTLVTLLGNIVLFHAMTPFARDVATLSTQRVKSRCSWREHCVCAGACL